MGRMRPVLPPSNGPIGKACRRTRPTMRIIDQKSIGRVSGAQPRAVHGLNRRRAFHAGYRMRAAVRAEAHGADLDPGRAGGADRAFKSEDNPRERAVAAPRAGRACSTCWTS